MVHIRPKTGVFVPFYGTYKRVELNRLRRQPFLTLSNYLF
jgi:hypothetical protein